MLLMMTKVKSPVLLDVRNMVRDLLDSGWKGGVTPEGMIRVVSKTGEEVEITGSNKETYWIRELIRERAK